MREWKSRNGESRRTRKRGKRAMEANKGKRKKEMEPGTFPGLVECIYEGALLLLPSGTIGGRRSTTSPPDDCRGA